MELNFIGRGGAINFSEGGNCAFIKQGGGLILLDCCEGCAEKLVRLNVLNESVKQIYLVITHTHADHVAGLGTLIWYCNFVLNVKPVFISNSESFTHSLYTLLDVFGVDRKYYEFTQDKTILNKTIVAIKTTHTEKLECYSFVISDENEKVFYSGDTNEIELIKKMAEDDSITKIYCEVSTLPIDVHIFYDDLKKLPNKEKLYLMHFSCDNDLEIIKKDNIFKVVECV